VLRGRINGYASFVTLILEGAVADEEPLELFLGSVELVKIQPPFSCP